jgi:hypothetical protein
MIVLVLKDGLGNQLFQYAAAKALASSLNTKLKLDISSYKYNTLREYSLCHFMIEEEFVSAFERLFFKIRLRLYSFSGISGKKGQAVKFLQNDFQYSSLIGQVKNNTWIEGYWQSEKYFQSIAATLRKELVVKDNENPYCQLLLLKIRSTNAVSIHVRRGDYVSDSKVNNAHGVCTLDYYRQAVQIIKEQIKNPVFFIFSDEIDWVKQYLIISGDEVVYVEGKDNKDYDELRLMFSCKHNIIANSSFSWWGAWLNTNPGKLVVAPQRWTQDGYYYNPDIIPENWIRINA